ncbi:MAG: S-layer homology domain-containing protein [Tissierellia bacterium]|nr:S-layer homology domain-containing protein [Tissierellia bacterium]
MNRKNRVLMCLVLILLFTTATTNAISITKNPKVDWLIEQGFVTGDSRGYRLKDNITRAEVTKMVVEAGGLGEDVEDFKHLISMFKDIPQNHWANGHINTAVINQLVNGYPDKTFGPSKNITYAEVVKMLVMANGDVPDTSNYTDALWAVPYIVKAKEVGITEDVNIQNYYEAATREVVFEMVFNTMFKEEPTIVEEYNGIIMENSRVAKLKKTEVSLLIFEDLNRNSDSEPRYKEDEKILITISKDIEDVEYLMGKVVDVTIDNKNRVLDIEVDTSYTYLDGPILAYKDELYCGYNGKYYRADSRLQVYHNDDDYRYYDYVNSLGERDKNGDRSFTAEFANITVKGGRLYYMDSFSFEDISPVQDVRGRGEDIIIYDDASEADLVETSVDQVIGYTYKWGFETLDISDIDRGDVIHIYDRNKAIVRQDSKDKNQLMDLFEYDGYYYADIDGDYYQVRTTKYRRPVYSTNGEDFNTLYAEDLDRDLIKLFDEEVTYLLDINGHIQAIIGK